MALPLDELKRELEQIDGAIAKTNEMRQDVLAEIIANYAPFKVGDMVIRKGTPNRLKVIGVAYDKRFEIKVAKLFKNGKTLDSRYNVFWDADDYELAA